ncbi:MAG: efflux RND transporter periplasmic adaptor subunit [Pirellulales bacterium]
MDDKQDTAEHAVSNVVTLSPEKLASAGIHLSKVATAEIRGMKTVSGTVGYDSTRYVIIEAPVDSVVEQLLVKPGQLVEQGDALAVLSGSDVALARSEINKCEADVRVARVDLDWNVETQKNLAQLLETLKQSPTIEDVVNQFEGKVLGEHRDHLLRTYTQYVLAHSIAERTKPLREQGVVSGKTAETRLSDQEAAAAEFLAACEQSEFDGRLALTRAQAEAEAAEQALAVSKEKLRLLLGPLAEASKSQSAGRFEIRAPFAGRIEASLTSPASRLTRGDAIMSLADTTMLWVSALIHQHDWDALVVSPTETVSVSFPALPDEQFEAKVSFVGPEVSPTTLAVSLVAELQNDDGRFRPGMFAWVDLPVDKPHQALVVPTSAVQRHESDAFVFVPDGPGRFRRVDVAIGLETPQQVEIKSGLTDGQEVVDQGAFFLKSELLLEHEE